MCIRDRSKLRAACRNREAILRARARCVFGRTWRHARTAVGVHDANTERGLPGCRIDRATGVGHLVVVVTERALELQSRDRFRKQLSLESVDARGAHVDGAEPRLAEWVRGVEAFLQVGILAVEDRRIPAQAMLEPFALDADL